jgi:hypothetical protein
MATTTRIPLSVTALEILAAAQAADGVAPILVGLGHFYQSYPAQWRSDGPPNVKRGSSSAVPRN